MFCPKPPPSVVFPPNDEPNIPPPVAVGALPNRPPGLAAVLPNNELLFDPPRSPVPRVGAAACVPKPPKLGAAAGLLNVLLNREGCWGV